MRDVRKEYEPTSLLSTKSAILLYGLCGDRLHFSCSTFEKIQSLLDIFLCRYFLFADNIGRNMAFLGIHDVWQQWLCKRS